jgi:hypothetical protein
MFMEDEMIKGIITQAEERAEKRSMENVPQNDSK